MSDNSPNISTDCLECRLVGGFSIILIAGYLWVQAKKRKRLEKTTIQLISGGTLGIGLARLFNFIPKKTEDTNIMGNKEK